MCSRRRRASPINTAAEAPSPVWSPLYPASPRPIQFDTGAGHHQSLEPVPEIESGEATPRPGLQRPIEIHPVEGTAVKSTAANPLASAPYAPMAASPTGFSVIRERVVPGLPQEGLVSGQEESGGKAAQEAAYQAPKATAPSKHAHSGESQDAPLVHRLDGTTTETNGEAAQVPTQGDVIGTHNLDKNPDDSILRRASDARSRTAQRVTINDQPQSAPPSRQGSDGTLGSVRRLAKAFTLPSLRRSRLSTTSPEEETSPEEQPEVAQNPIANVVADADNTPSRKDSAFTLGSNRGATNSPSPRTAGPGIPPPYAATSAYDDPNLGTAVAEERIAALADNIPRRGDYQVLFPEPHQSPSVGPQQPQNLGATVDGSSTSRMPSEPTHDPAPQTAEVIPTVGNHAALLVINQKPRRLDRVRYYSPKWIVKASMGRKAADEVCFKIRAAQAGIRLEVAR